MPEIAGKKVSWIGVGMITLFVFICSTGSHYTLFWLLSKVDALGMDVGTNTALLWFSMGVTGFLLLVVLISLTGKRFVTDFPKQMRIIPYLVLFLLLFVTFYALDQWIPDIRFSIYPLLLFSLLLTMMFPVNAVSRIRKAIKQ
ncbi:hypothetical protein [Melghirimyces algeriensis]|uniref:Uncharacterized protein n=1 Tax=Melghirimyces algeriensis TaxID=910412 RepID=A0A521D849_9BACL|nr:hypothetical protein [Melghirimyces algeriensis]SMO67864.1 hypothetical protein SAMN06264849_105204 [Melghirimyces algeriensis]